MKNTTLDKIQTKAVKAIHKAMESGDKCLVEMATGTGKTRTYVKYLKKHAEGKKVLVLTHMNELVDQHAKALHDGGIKAGFYTSVTKELDRDVIVASIPTVSRKNHLKALRCKKFDLVVVDEAHHSPATSWKEVLDAFPKVKRIGLTATPFRPDQLPLTEQFGEIIYSVPFRKAQELELIAKHEAWVILTDSVIDGGPTKYGDYSKRALDRLFSLEDRDRLIVESYKKYGRDGMDKAGIKRKAVCFCVNSRHAERLSKLFTKAGVKSRFLVSNAEYLSTAERKKVFATFKHDDTIEMLCVVSIFNEGVDIPGIGCALMARPTMSNIVYQQQIGRAARLTKGVKEKFIVLDYVDVTRKDFRAYRSDNLEGKPVSPNRVVCEYLKDPDPVNVHARVNDIISNVERFEAALRVEWTPELILEDARRFQNYTEWRKDQKSIQAARARGITKEIARKLKWTANEQSVERLMADVKKFKSYAEWRKKDQPSYAYARKLGLLDKVTQVRGWKRKQFVKWTRESVGNEAKKFGSRSEWIKKSPGSYHWAKRNAIFTQICESMSLNPERKGRGYWTFDTLLASAKRFKSGGDWYKGDKKAYGSATRRKLFLEIADRLGWKVRRENGKVIKKGKK